MQKLCLFIQGMYKFPDYPQRILAQSPQILKNDYVSEDNIAVRGIKAKTGSLGQAGYVCVDLP